MRCRRSCASERDLLTAPRDPDAGSALTRWLWVALLLLAAALRLSGADWDGGLAAHPDERYLVDVALATPLWGDPTLAAPEFPYGHFPLYVLRLLTALAPGADPLYAGRLLSGLLGVLLVAAAGALGRCLAGRRGGLLAAALLACAPFALQQARFFTVDVPGAVCVSLALLLALRRRFGGAGAFWGLAVACKASLIWGGAPLLVAIFCLSGASPAGETPPPGKARAVRRVASLLLGAALSFVLASPWAVLRPAAAWRGPWIQSLMVAGQLDFPYTRQFVGTLPFLYPLAQLGLWGMGPAATLTGLLGLLGAAGRWRRLSPPARLLWGGTLMGFVALAGGYVKFPRYLLPLYPLWGAWAAAFLVRGGEGTPAEGQGRKGKVARRIAIGAVVLSTALLGAAQLSLYVRPHPWETASRWLYANLPEGAQIAVEHWDHPLPIPLPEGSAERFVQRSLPVMDEDTPEKLAQLEAALKTSDVIVWASARGYGALARQPERYAATLAWYARVMTERQLLAFGRCPRLGPLALSDDPLADAGLPTPLTLAERCGTPLALRLPHLDESFRVYDAPMVLLALRAP